MKSQRIHAILYSLVFLASVESSSLAATYTVSPDGDNTKDGKSVETAFQTLLRAVATIKGGDTVYPQVGIYRESIRLDAHKHGTTAENV